MSDAILQEKLLAVMQELQDRQKFWKMKTFSPYGWQKDFITASSNCFQLLAMTGNRCGKTYTGGYIMSCHLTGLYPDWWDGRRYDRPVEAWAAGISTDTTRDILQSELLGKWNDPMKFGTGMIPKEMILETVNKPGVPGAFQAVLVKHVSGGVSTLVFKSYEMSQDKFMGTSIDVVWLDEECPKNIFTQCVTRTATNGGIVYLTFTPEAGLTELVKDFMYDIKPGQYMGSASWEDAPHLDDAVKEQLMGVYTEAERRMRTTGQPSIGSGLVFPIPEADIVISPFPIPEHWMRIIGIDLGFDHPNGVASIAWDQENDVYYLCDEYSRSGENLALLADAIRAKGGQQIPVVVPHDAMKRDGASSGARFIDLLRGFGLNMVNDPFSNPPGIDGKHGGNSVEFGVNWMFTRMDQGSFRVFATCSKFLQEMKLYHRKDGVIIDKNDDMISAARYGCLMATRHARPGGLLNSSYYNTSKILKPSWFSGVV